MGQRDPLDVRQDHSLPRSGAMKALSDGSKGPMDGSNRLLAAFIRVAPASNRPGVPHVPQIGETKGLADGSNRPEDGLVPKIGAIQGRADGSRPGQDRDLGAAGGRRVGLGIACESGAVGCGAGRFALAGVARASGWAAAPFSGAPGRGLRGGWRSGAPAHREASTVVARASRASPARTPAAAMPACTILPVAGFVSRDLIHQRSVSS